LPRWSTSLIVLADSHETAAARRTLLEQAGHATAGAETGASAVELARLWAPDLIIVHDPLPDASTVELCGRLESDASVQEVPILITGGAGPAKGNPLWLPEPVDAPVLLAMAAALTRDRRRGSDDLSGERGIAVLEKFLAEAALEQNEKKLRRILEANIIGVVCAGPAGVFEANDIFLEMLGYTKADLPLAWSAVLAPEFRERAGELGGEIVSRGFVKAFEAECIHKDGRSVPVLAGSALYSGAPEWVCFVLDLTERKRIERALAESEAHFRLALEGSPVVVFSQDRELRYTWIYNPRELESREGRTEIEIFPHEEAVLLQAFKRRVMETGTRARQEFALTVRGGERRNFDIWVEPLLDAAGRLVGVTGAAVDITERKTIEARLRESSKLETIGRLGAGIAHDFNNVLATVIGGASYALGLVPEGHAAHRVMQMVLEGGQRAARITSQLAAYAGEGRFEIESVDISRLVLELEPMLRSSVAGFIDLRPALADGLPPVKADPRQLQDLVVNLVLNAAEAIPAGSPGVIDIRTGVRCGVGDSRVLLEVADTGCGMDEETQRQIFDPFFSTKFMGRGLGLAAVAGIVRSHDGSIEVHSAPGAGSRFTVLLPAAAPCAETAAEES
jgi:PAS domain S-box-containing protein